MSGSMKLTCITCPIGCLLSVKSVDGKFVITGNKCKKGEVYAISELTNPKRIITSTVQTVFSDFPRVSVKTDREVPLKDLFKYMDEINKTVVSKRLKPGDIIISNILGTQTNLTATDKM